MSDVDLGKWNRKPYHRFHFVENCVWALNYVRDNGVSLTNIGAEGKIPLFLVPCSLFPVPCSLVPGPCSLFFVSTRSWRIGLM